MAYLHENKVEFLTAVNLASSRFGILPAVAEKDYYVTMVLRQLSGRLPFIVFKGGTSLSKCYRVIKRFSEDIDIAIDTKITQGQKQKVKAAVKESAAEIGMTIPNIEDTRSRRDYNRYILTYDSVLNEINDAARPAVILETSYFELSFPTVSLPVHNYIGDMMLTEAPDAIVQFQLDNCLSTLRAELYALSSISAPQF